MREFSVPATTQIGPDEALTDCATGGDQWYGPQWYASRDSYTACLFTGSTQPVVISGLLVLSLGIGILWFGRRTPAGAGAVRGRLTGNVRRRPPTGRRRPGSVL